MSVRSYDALTPTRFLDRAAQVFRTRVAVSDGQTRLTFGELADRIDALTGLLAARNIAPGDRVAVLSSNSRVMIEAHNAIPLRGAVMVPLNTRLSSTELNYVIEHSGASLILASEEHLEAATHLAEGAGIGVLHGEGSRYERELTASSPARVPLADERSPLAINYTSGTTGRPKGVVLHHRGAYLQSLAMAYHLDLRPRSRYLWTLPMFHCNGWCLTWAVTAAGGTHVCLRNLEVTEVWRHLFDGVTHFSAAPTVLTMLAEADGSAAPLPRPVAVSTGGAPPTPALLKRMAALNLHVTHLYGLTESFGPIFVNDWMPEWDQLDHDTQASLRARQGIPNIVSLPARIIDEAGEDISADGESIGEVALSGNTVMAEYYLEDGATQEASSDGWLRTGDLGLTHADGYLELKDRRKDLIISGGENIASVEVERVLGEHPQVLECAVVGAPHATWGERPIGFVTARDPSAALEAELREFVRARLAGFKVPDRIEFDELPKTSTGKIRKDVLRERALSATATSAGNGSRPDGQRSPDGRTP